MQGLIILDRDGVINYDSPDYIKSAKEWRPIEGSLEAIARLTHAEYRVFVASNQSGIGREILDYADFFSINDKMMRKVDELGGRIDGVFFCPHTPQDNCDCRKPKPGLLLQIAQRLQTDLSGVPFIGDSLTDLNAALAAGAQPMLVRTGNGVATEAKLVGDLLNTPVYDDLAAAVKQMLDAAAGK